MSGTPAPESPGSESPPPESPSLQPAERSRRKKILTPIVLAFVGLVLLLAAFGLYPRTTQRPGPAFSRVYVFPTAPLAFIDYTVVQLGSEAEIQIGLVLAGNLPRGGAGAGLEIGPPFGTTLVGCARSDCTNGMWHVGVVFTSDRVTASFIVRAASFGVVTNDVTASAAIPEIFYQSTGTPVLLTGYQIPSASSYDWSSYPTYSVSKTTAVWEEALLQGDTVGRAAVGTNHSAQTSDDFKTFVAGALLGLAGGALLSAVQEALHASD